MADGAVVRVLEGYTDDVSSVCVTADGAHVVSGSYDKTARVCPIDTYLLTAGRARSNDMHATTKPAPRGARNFFLPPVAGRHLVCVQCAPIAPPRALPF